MTNQEAKEIISHVLWCTPVEVDEDALKENKYAQHDHDNYREALEMAIKALEKLEEPL